MATLLLGRRVMLLCLLYVGVAGVNAQLPESALKAHVTIYRDHYGVPHIIGDSEEATFFGYGYAQAQDHLEGMMMQYRDAQGRRSEVLGKAALGGDQLVYHPDDYRWDGDYLQRLLRTHQAVDEHRSSIDPTVYRMLEAFAQGVNCFIRENRQGIPAWIDGVTPEDLEALERSNYMRFYSVGDALSKLPGKVPTPLPKLGSNHWAVSPQRSANGHVMHVEHLHMPWGNRFQLYEAQLVTPGKLNVGGIGWFGSPFFLSGFNEKVTWSVSFNQPNISDVYEEQINPVNSFEYLYEGAWRKVTRDSASFKVKTAGGAWKTETLPLYYTHHGPIVRFDSERHRAYAVRLPNFDGVNYSTGLYRLLKAENVQEFKAALSLQLIPRWNFLCTDQDDIYWVHNGVVARRNPTYNWLKPVPGWTKETEWNGYLPFSANPQVINPDVGFVQNANNPPWVVTRRSGLKPLDPTPYYLSYPVRADSGEEVLNTRGERLFGVLTRPGERFTFSQMVSLGFDTYILAADVVVPLLREAAKKHLDDRKLREVVDEIGKWNRRAEEDSFGFTYLFYWDAAYRELFPWQKADRFSSYRRSEIDTFSEREQDLAWNALRESVSRIEKLYGRSKVRWGDINRVIRGGDFPVAGTGAFGVLHPDEGPSGSNGQIHCDDGWGHLMVVIESNPKQIWSLLPYGESQNPDSAHYNDQAKLHSARELKQFWASRQDIIRNTESIWGEKNRIQRAQF